MAEERIFLEKWPGMGHQKTFMWEAPRSMESQSPCGLGRTPTVGEGHKVAKPELGEENAHMEDGLSWGFRAQSEKGISTEGFPGVGIRDLAVGVMGLCKVAV